MLHRVCAQRFQRMKVPTAHVWPFLCTSAALQKVWDWIPQRMSSSNGCSEMCIRDRCMDAPMHSNPRHEPLDGRSNGKQTRMDHGSIPDTRWRMTISAESSHTLSVEMLRCSGMAIRALWVLSCAETVGTYSVQHRQKSYIASSPLARCSTSP